MEETETADYTEVFFEEISWTWRELETSKRAWKSSLDFGRNPEGAGAVVALRRRFRFEVTVLSKPLNSPRQAQLISTSPSHKSILTWEFRDLRKLISIYQNLFQREVLWYEFLRQFGVKRQRKSQNSIKTWTGNPRWLLYSLNLLSNLIALIKQSSRYFRLIRGKMNKSTTTC